MFFIATYIFSEDLNFAYFSSTSFFLSLTAAFEIEKVYDIDAEKGMMKLRFTGDVFKRIRINSVNVIIYNLERNKISRGTIQDIEEGNIIVTKLQYSRAYTLLNNPTVGFTINIQCEAKVYIDDVSVVEVGGDGTNLLANPGFEGAPVWEPSYPDVSAPTTTKALEEWTATASGSSITTRTFVTSVGAENAYGGTQSMYVEFVADSYGKNWVNISNTGTQMASLDANKSYTV